jgi:hypothetical protein
VPDFLIPCWPAFIGPLPFALVAISSRAFASGERVSSAQYETARLVCRLARSGAMRTGALFSLVSDLVLVKFFLLLLRCLEGLGFAACGGDLSAG